MTRKSIASILLTLLIASLLPMSVLSAETVSATPTSSTILVNGKSVAFDAYNINDNNYFKLRDVARTLSDTEKQFEVEWDGANNVIVLTSGKPYTAVGGEMTGKGSGNKTATKTNSSIYLEGKEVAFTAYNIENNNYFKLRDIGASFNFSVEWDGANNTVIIDTSSKYDDVEKPVTITNRLMTLDDVRRFAGQSAELTVKDFSDYDCTYTKFSGGETREYPIAGDKWKLNVNINIVDGTQILSIWLIPSGYKFQPQGMIGLRDGNVAGYIAYVESYDGTQAQLSVDEENAAYAVALEYETSTNTEKVVSIKYISDVTEYAWAVIVDQVKGKIAGFYATIDNGLPPRLIVLTQNGSGKWEVINEGY